MKKLLLATAALIALPALAEAQSQPMPGFYIGGEGGLNWMFNTTANVPGFGGAANIYPATGWQAGGMVGYDFVGPRIELEGVFRQNQATLQAAPIGFQQFTAGANINQTAIMANLIYDFRFGSPIVPYIGAGAGIAFVNASALGGSTSSTQFAYQGIIGVGYEIDSNWRFNIDGRYFGTTNPTINNPVIGGVTYNNNNISLMASLQYQVRRAGHGGSAAAADLGRAAVLHGVLRLGPREPLAAGADHDPAGGQRLQDQGKCPHYGDRPYRHVGPGGLQHGAVAASRQRRQGCAGARRRAGPGDHGHRQG